MTYRVQIATRMADVDPGHWDALIHDTKESIFYHRSFLEAFEKHPLHPVERTAYLTMLTPSGRPAAALPAFLMRGTDPMRVLATHFPDITAEPALLSHVWHCYQTTLPTHPRHPEAADAAMAAFTELAQEWKASLCGLVNIDHQDPLAARLTARGIPGTNIETGWGMDIATFANLDAYITGLVRKRRTIMRQYLRRAHEAGVRTRFTPAVDGDLDGFVRLARHTAEKFDNADYYQPGLFQDFVLHLGDHAWLLELHLDGQLIGSALVLLDDARIHFFATGFDLTASPRFSPFYLLFARTVQEGITRRLPWLAAGRRNPDFKRRHNLTPTALTAHLKLVTT
ncbi:GNAT family N-acetyltransferase [Actinomadura sp. KC06]|uniref:GNAT family N-acetyltransferase n=1 Tax=Actinomadura sp. KC06 TaxID=2530369 RepID=UPI0010495DB9|nr:GNAT family N-acetyltransferase [Actinomadura sp. KC06]TDD29605.1 GNAT family N-acetyltransferase [Actinomadura sp. KC06]